MEGCLFFKDFIFTFNYYMYMRAQYYWRLEKGFRSPETGVTGSCELPDVGSGK